MIRPTLYIFSKSEVMKDSISRFVKYIGIKDSGLIHEFVPNRHANTYTFFEEIGSFFAKEQPETLLNTAVIMDISDFFEQIPDHLDPIDPFLDNRWHTLSVLILAYPEIYWILFGGSYNKPKNELPWMKEHFVDATNIEDCIDLLKRHQNGYRPLFDPSGLRTNLKLNIIETENKYKKEDRPKVFQDMSILNSRQNKCAVVIDEELPFTYLNGYASYRFGYRCYTITSKAEMEKALVNKSGTNKIDYSLEDLELRFSDMTYEETDKYLDPERRLQDFPSLMNANRFYITGVATPKQKTIFGNRIIEKPYSGIYDFSFKTNIQNKLKDSLSIKYLKFHRQVMFEIANFIKASVDITKNIFRMNKQYQNNNDKPEDSISNKKESKGHSPNNRVLLIADFLIGRAQNILKESKCCQDAVHGAILALEAKELLCAHSMTTSLEAISLQHQLEVQAECSFYGVGHEIHTSSRLSELATEVDYSVGIGNSSNASSEKFSQSFNAQLEIVNNLSLIFREYEQFDEADKCLNEVRVLRQGLHYFGRFSKEIDYKPVKRLWAITGEKYFNFLVSSGWKMLVCIALWIIFFTILYSSYLALNYRGQFYPSLNPTTLSQSALSFFEMQPADIIETQFGKEFTNSSYFNVITFFELVIAYIHLGIFIAYLYQKLSRR